MAHIEIREAIEQSCNYYFNMVGFKLGQDGEGNFSENRSLAVLQKYASLIGLDKKTGIEITESSPHVSRFIWLYPLISDRVPMPILPVSWQDMPQRLPPVELYMI